MVCVALASDGGLVRVFWRESYREMLPFVRWCVCVFALCGVTMLMHGDKLCCSGGDVCGVVLCSAIKA